MTNKVKLQWTGPALEDLCELRCYVSQDKPAAALKLAQLIEKKALRLLEHPLSGRLVPELAELGYREVIIPPYRIVYEVRKKEVNILRVWHSRMALK